MPEPLANTQDLVEVEDIREGAVILKNGSFRQVIMVGGINFSLKSEGEQGLIVQQYQNFLNGLSFPVQIIIHSRKINIERYLATLEERKTQEISGLLQDQISEYQEFIRSFVAQNAIMEKTFFVVVPFSPVSLPTKTSFIDSLPFFGKKKGREELAAEKTKSSEVEFQENLSQLTQRTNQVLQGLSSIGVEAVILNDEQLVELYYNFYNPETIERGYKEKK